MITREYLIPPKVEEPLDLPGIPGKEPSSAATEEPASTSTSFRDEPDFPSIPGDVILPTVSPKIIYIQDERKLVVRHTEAAHASIRQQVEDRWRAYYARQKISH